MLCSILQLPKRPVAWRSTALFLALTLTSACSGNQTSAGDSTQLPVISAETTAPSPAPTSAAPNTTETTAEVDLNELPLPGSAAELAQQISEVELAIVDPETPVEQLSSLGRRQQALYQLLDIQRDWVPEVEAGIDPTLKTVFDQNWQAKQALTSLVGTERVHSSLPAWRLVEPDPADELLGHYKAAEGATGIDWEYVAAINLVETRMGRIEGVSTAGAVGPMQFLPTTWNECCEGDPTNTSDAIRGAAKYLTDRGGPSDMDKAILGYNNSQFYVDAVKAYADVLRVDERSYYAYHGWEVYFQTSEGLILMPSDYEESEEVPVGEWLKENPNTAFPDGYNK